MFLEIVTFLMVFVIGWIGMFQIVIPIATGKKIFPAFRSTEAIKEKIIAKNSEFEDENLLDHLHELDTKIIEKRQRRESK